MSEKSSKENLMGKVVSKAWEDPEFKKRLVADTADVLREYGIDVPPDLKVQAVEDRSDLVHIIIPHKPPIVDIKPGGSLENIDTCNCWQGEAWN